MSKILKIRGVIEPEMLVELAGQIEQQKIETGDSVDVVFDSVGGAVDVAFQIAGAFEEMQNSGVNMRGIAEGKVYSSAIVPFLSLNDRVAVNGSSFLVHKATYNNLTDINKDELRELQNELEAYTDILYDFYDDHGIVREVRSFLKQGNGITIEKPNDMIAAGFISKIVNERQPIYNRIMRGIDRLFPSSPNFSYIVNSNQIQQHAMTNKQIKDLVAEGFKEAMPEIIQGIASVIKNEMIPETEDEPMNEAAEMSPEELGKLSGVMFKSPATVEGSDEVKYLTHPTKDVEKDHFVIPISEDGSVVKLAEGNYKVNVGDDTYAIHSTGAEWYISSSGTDNQESEEKPDEVSTLEETEIPANEVPAETEKAEKCTLKVTNKQTSVAPKPNTQKAPIGIKNKYAEDMHELFAPYGSGCVGSKS